MATPIVQINVSVTNAPVPNLLQRTGALVSQGGTTGAVNSLSLLTQLSDLTPLLMGAKSISAMTWASSVVTFTSTAHGYPIGDSLQLSIAGTTPAAYNGTFPCTIIDANTISYNLASNPGVVTIQGKVTDVDVAYLLEMATTFFAQGTNQSVYMLELGSGTPAQGVTALGAYITLYPNSFYSYLVPRGWDAEPTFPAFLASFESNTAMTYFFVTATLSTYTNFTALMKCVFMMIESPLIPATEYTLASTFWKTLSYNPSSSNQVGPLCFSYAVGVTPYAVTGPQATSFKSANLNYITTGAEGGISNTMLVWGHMCDGNPFNYWYSIDWTQINLNLDLSNEIINGSNNSLAPLYYNQPGINRLQNRAAGTAKRAISYGLALGTVVTTQLPAAQFAAAVAAGTYNGFFVINAEPFSAYNAENPNDYAIGKYAGLSAGFTPARGFEMLIVNLNVTNFVA